MLLMPELKSITLSILPKSNYLAAILIFTALDIYFKKRKKRKKKVLSQAV